MNLKRFKKIVKWFLLSLLFLIAAAYIFIQTPFGQNWIGRQVTSRLSRDLKTKISIQHVEFSLFNRMHLRGVMIEDQKGDTLLFAGDLKVSITDWFFFKNEADLKYIGLEDALIKFQRTDSVWSQQFIFDYFSSPTSGKPKKNSGITINLKKIEFKNVHFFQKDAWMGQDMDFRIGGMMMNADQLSFSDKQYVIKDLSLKEPVITLTNYTRKKPQSTTVVSDDKEIAASWNSGTIFKIGNFTIENGSFKQDNINAGIAASPFDGQHMLFTEINGSLANSSFIGDTVLSDLKLSAKEKSGLQLKNLSAKFRLTPRGMYFDNMDLETNRSHLRKYYAMTYRNISDMSVYLSRVIMEANFENSFIDSDDLAFFSPNLKTWKKKIKISGKASGTVEALKGTNLMVQAGENTLFSGDLALTGLPDINTTYIDMRADELRSNYSDAVTIVPMLRKVTVPNLRSIQYLKFKGGFKGYLNDFITVGVINTNLGVVSTDLHYNSKGREPVFTAKLVTEGFHLGSFIGDKKIGAIALSGTIKGTGFSDKSRNIEIDTRLRYAEFDHYRYQDITIDGKLIKNLFSGYASVHDPNADLTMRGQMDINRDHPRFNLMADIAHIDLLKTGLSKDSLSFRGQANLNFTGSTIDDFLGEARITSAELLRNGHPLPFDSLVVITSEVNGQKRLSVTSNEFTAKINGQFQFSELPNAVTYLLNRYYPSYIKAPSHLPVNEKFDFDIYTYSVEEYMTIIDPNLGGFNNAHLQGRLDLAMHEVELNAEIPNFRYNKLNLNYTRINAKGNNESLVITGEANDIRINDSLSIPQTIFHVSARNDSSHVAITTGARAIEKADLNALILTYDDGLKIEFDNSNFSINGKVWTIDPNGELVLRRNTPATGNLVLSEGDQRIVVKTSPAPGQQWNNIDVEVTKLNLGDLSPYFLPHNRIEGLISGKIFVEDPTGNLKIRSDDLSTQFLRIDDDSLGELRTNVFYDNKDGQLRVHGNTLNQLNYLGFDANIFLTDKEKAKNNLITLNANNFQMNILERFLGTIFSDIRGYLTGNIKVSGPFDELSVTGKGHLKDAGVRIKMTQCFYWIRDTDIQLDSTEIDFGGLLLTDSVTKNPIYVNRGRIEHQFFKNMFYDIDISTRKPGSSADGQNLPVQLLNTTATDSKQFYGNVRGTASLSLTGPQSDMYIKIDAVASTIDSSFVTLPPSSGRESGIADYLVERKYGREMTVEDLRNNNSTNVTYDIDMAVTKTVTPMVSVNVVMDELTGDEIKGKGYGILNIHSGTSEPLSLQGRFNIVQGRYLFTFQSFFKKPFELRTEHDNFIEWNGNPYNANINFEAVYKAERVSFAPLGLSTISSNARGDVYVVASLKDSLYKPTIQFALDFPSTSIAVTDPELALIFQQMQKTPDEIVRQSTYLIVFNSFAPTELQGSNYSVASLGLTTISGIFLNVINEQVNKILGNLLKSDKYNISLNTSIYTRNVIDLTSGKIQLGGNINFSIGRSFFNNRFKISTGIGYDTPIEQQGITQTFGSQLLPDVTMEWLINPSGTVRASFFYRENTDYLQSATANVPGKDRRVGANISYRKDFDRLWDIFKRRKKSEKNLPVQPTTQEGIPIKNL